MDKSALSIFDDDGERISLVLIDGDVGPENIMPWLESIAQLTSEEQLQCLEYLGYFGGNCWSFTNVTWEYMLFRGYVLVDSIQIEESNTGRNWDLDPFKDNDTADINPRWLSLSQACRYASMSDKTLMCYVRQGEIYGSRKGGKWYIDRLSIDSFFQSDNVFVRDAIDRIMGRVS